MTKKKLRQLSRKAKLTLENIEILYSIMPFLDTEKKPDCYESHASVKTLCEFWNQQVPKELRAEGFNVYYCHPCEKVFTSGDREEPDISFDVLIGMTDSMLFINDEYIKIAFVFFKGKEHYQRKEGYVSVLQANGDVLLEQQDLKEYPLDQAYYSIQGLRSLLNEMCSLDNLHEGISEWRFSKLFG